MEALPRIVVCIHKSLPAEPPAALSDPATAALGMALPLLFSAVSNDYERPVVASAVTALGGLCNGLPPGSLAHVAPALVEAIEGNPSPPFLPPRLLCPQLPVCFRSPPASSGNLPPPTAQCCAACCRARAGSARRAAEHHCNHRTSQP